MNKQELKKEVEKRLVRKYFKISHPNKDYGGILKVLDLEEAIETVNKIIDEYLQTIEETEEKIFKM